MRYDQTTVFNSSLEHQARICDQMVAFHEHEAAKAKATAKVLRSAASTDPQDGDVELDGLPFNLPKVAVAKPTEAEIVEEYGRHGGQKNVSAAKGGGAQDQMHPAIPLEAGDELDAQIAEVAKQRRAA